MIGLRGKTIVTLLAMFIAMGLSIFMIFQSFYENSIMTVDRGEAEDAVRRVAVFIDDDLHQLDTICRDWAYWDDSYEFAAGNGDDYIASNLGGGQTLELLGISGMLIDDASGRTLYEYGATRELIARIREGIHTADQTRIGVGTLGLVIAEGEVHLVVARPILKSDLGGPPGGLIAMARKMDEQWIERYSRFSGRLVMVEPEPWSDSRQPSSAERVTFDLDDAVIRASLVKPALAVRQAIRLTVESPTIKARYGTTKFLYFSGLVIGVIALMGGLIILQLERMVMGRMKAIGADLNHLAASHDPSIRISVSGNDELSALCTAMNASLERLESMIDERETMIREIHHRVKNNLQVIASMLSLQASSACSDETQAAFQRSRLRLQAIAVVYDSVLEYPSLNRIGILGLLGRITTLVEQNQSKDFAPTIRLQGDDAEIDLKTAMPIALLSSEVIHNAFEHAFENRKKGELTLGVVRRNDAWLELEIHDDGIGIPGMEHRKRGIGLTLIDALTLQLRGHYSITPAPGGGTVFRLEVPIG